MPQAQAQGQTSNKFWNFIPGTPTSPPELLLYGAISSTQSWWNDRVTPQQFNQELAQISDADEIIVRINSGGGDVFAANAIYTRLKDCKAKVIVKIDGWAASAATIIAMAGDEIRIAKNGIFMIHDPSMTVWDSYTAEEFKKMAAELEVIKQSIINTYSAKTGMDEKEIADLMAEETWWTGEDAVSNKFCDSLLFDESNKAIESNTTIENGSHIVVNSVDIDLSSYKTVPKSLFNLVTNRMSSKPEVKNSEGEEKNMEIKTVQDLVAKFPELVNQIRNEAVQEERNRIKNLEEIAVDGYESIINDAKFENPITAEQAAIRILNEQKKAGTDFLSGREEDVENSGMQEVKNESNGALPKDKKSVYDEAIDQIL